MWVHSPIAIRIKSPKSTLCTSGINLQFIEHDTIKWEFNLTISVIPPDLLTAQQVKYYVTSDCFVSDDEINWYETSLDFYLDPLKEQLGLYELLQYFKSNGFRLLPQEYSTGVSSINLVNLKPVKSMKNNGGSVPIKFVNSQQYGPIQIIGFPFNFTNAALFSNFRLNGSINSINRFGYLTDVKYIDNMVGSVTNVGPGPVSTGTNGVTESLGLVLTNLRKFNGDGDLLFILSWDIIWGLISHHFNSSLLPNPRINKLLAASQQKYHYDDTKNSIVPILISSDFRQTWGSCIIFNQEYLVTNYHVIGGGGGDGSGGGNKLIYLTEHTVLDVTNEETFNFKEIDISFIKLSLTNQFKLNSCHSYSPCNYTTNYEIDDHVTTVGYGLFFNKHHLSPLISHGHILTKKQLRFHNQSKIPSLLITSAGCWNGSSGGGLFKQQNLIGVVCSNAQINTLNLDTNEEIHEKLSKFCFIVPIEIILICYESIKNNKSFDINNEFIQWWGLSTTHMDKFNPLEPHINAKL